MAEVYFTKEHEWVRLEGKVARIGITDYAQEELGDVVFVELPALDDEVEEGEGFAVVESVKAVSDIYSPVNGMIVGVNDKLEDSPELINESPMEKGWIAEIEITDSSHLKDLMNEEEYTAYIKEV